MARLHPLPVTEWPPEMRDAMRAAQPLSPRYSLISKDRPKGASILGALAHHPALARAYFTLNAHLLMATSLTERQRELVIMRVAVARRSDYEWAQHIFMARDAGLTDLEIAGVAWGPNSPFWDEGDRFLLRAVDELVHDGVIGDQTWTVLTKHLDTRQILDVIFTAGSYATVASMVESLGIDLDDDLHDSVAALIRPTPAADHDVPGSHG